MDLFKALEVEVKVDKSVLKSAWTYLTCNKKVRK